MKGFGEEGLFSHSKSCPTVFVWERCVILPLNGNEEKEAKIKKKKDLWVWIYSKIPTTV